MIPTIESTSGWLRVIRQIKALFHPLEFTEKLSAGCSSGEYVGIYSISI